MKHLPLLLTHLLWISNCLNGQLPKLIKNVGEVGSHGMNIGWTYPNVFANAEGRLLFWGTNEQYGTELWVTDGTSEGTQLVKDIIPGPGSPPTIHNYYKENDRGVYFAFGEIGEREIWFSDGTQQNTKRLLKETEQYRFDPNITSFNSSAVVYNNFFVVGYTSDASGMKRCIYRLEPENENVNPSSVIFWMDTLPMTQNHSGIIEVCEFQGQLVAIAESATTMGLITINRDYGYTTWLVRAPGYIYHLGNINNEFLAFIYPGPNNSLACIRDLNSASLEILLSPSFYASPLEDNQVVKTVVNKLYFYTDQYSQNLWVTDGTSEGTQPAPFQGTTRLVGKKGNDVVVLLKNDDGLYSLISWDGSNNYKIISEDHSSILPSTTSYLEVPNRQYIFSYSLIALINGKSYTIFGVPNQGDSTMINFTYSMGYQTKNKIGNNLIISGWNNMLVSENAIGQEPYKFPLDIKLWTGANSTEWHDPLNWHPEGVPTITESILIPETPTSNYPVLNQDGSCLNLFANYGGVSVGANSSLTIAGELSNYWALSGAGKIIMTATQPADITGSGEYTFSRLELPSLEYQIRDESKKIASKIILGPSTKVFLNDVNLVLNTEDPDPIENFSSSSYIVTNGRGSLGMSLGTNTGQGTQQILPIGQSSYNPAKIAYEGSIPAVFLGKVIDEAFENGIQGNSINISNINRTWDIKKIGGDQTNSNLLFQWQGSDELPGFDRNKCFVRHYFDEKWQNGDVGQASIELNGMYAKEMRDVDSFSPFTVSSNLSALPLKLLSFKSKVDQDLCQLMWTTAGEINVSHFEIEHATIQDQFSRIGIVYARNIGENTSDYTFLHRLKNEMNYFRLKIVDRDGSFFYSQILSANSNNNIQFKIYPNPVKDLLIISTPQRHAISYVKIHNSKGQIVYVSQSTSLQSNHQVINLGRLPNSLYYVEIHTEDGGVIRKTITKQ